MPHQASHRLRISRRRRGFRRPSGTLPHPPGGTDGRYLRRSSGRRSSPGRSRDTMSLPTAEHRHVRTALATTHTWWESGGMDPLSGGARVPPAPPRPPAPPATGGGPPAPDGPAPSVRALGVPLLRWIREVVAGVRSVTWPSRTSASANARIVAGTLGGLAIAIGALDVAFGSAIASLVR